MKKEHLIAGTIIGSIIVSILALFTAKKLVFKSREDMYERGFIE